MQDFFHQQYVKLFFSCRKTPGKYTWKHLKITYRTSSQTAKRMAGWQEGSWITPGWYEAWVILIGYNRDPYFMAYEIILLYYKPGLITFIPPRKKNRKVIRCFKPNITTHAPRASFEGGWSLGWLVTHCREWSKATTKGADWTHRVAWKV